MKGKERKVFPLFGWRNIEKRNKGHDQELFSVADNFFTKNYFLSWFFP